MNGLVNDIKWLTLQYNTGRSLQSIADELGVCRNTIRNRLAKHGIPRRHPWEHRIGTSLSEKHRENLSLSKKQYWAEHPMTDELRLRISEKRTKTGVSVKGRRIFIPGRGRVLEHRLVAEQMLGRLLESSEHVHHIDGNRLNNCPANLIVLTNGEHQKLHNETKNRDDKGRFVSCAD